MVDPLVTVTGVHHAYAGTPVLHGIDLDIEPGEIVCLLGPSGCGKTTLLRCIAGLEALRSGSIHIAGDELSSAQRTVPPERRGVGMVFQDFALFPHRRVADNVGFGLRGMSAAARRERVRAALQRVHADDLAHSWPHQLSGGQQQRVALARALAPEPRLMLLDEPFSGLDASLRRALGDDTRLLLKELNMGTLLVTHDGEEALHMADRIILMNHGHIVHDGSPEQVWLSPVDVFSAAFFGDCHVLDGVVCDGVVPVGPLRIAANGQADGSEVQVVIRHDSLRLHPADDDDAALRVIDERFLGSLRQTTVELRHRGERLVLCARHGRDQHFCVGDRVCASVAPGGAFCFSRAVTKTE